MFVCDAHKLIHEQIRRVESPRSQAQRKDGKMIIRLVGLMNKKVERDRRRTHINDILLNEMPRQKQSQRLAAQD